MRRSPVSSLAFTIIELLVVVAIIALLVGILLPAIGKARDGAALSRSQANIKQISTATFTYGAEWGDRQPTFINDNISHYGTSATPAFNNFASLTGANHPWIWLGYGNNNGAGVVYGYAPPPDSVRTSVFQPIDFFEPVNTVDQKRFGSFRLVQVRAVNTYVNGRFYDPVFYAPKDTAVINSVETYLTVASEYLSVGFGVPAKYSSYCFSAAGMFNPYVLSKNASGKFYTNPWSVQSGFRSPSFAQATYPGLKTHIIEHHWLQNRKKPCAPGFTGGIYDNCQPYMFNHAFNSQPVTSFYDGHLEPIGQELNIAGTARVVEQTGEGNHGLWSMDTPLGPGLDQFDMDAPMGGGYYMSQGQDWSSTSYHVLTIDGIKGRDMLSK